MTTETCEAPPATARLDGLAPEELAADHEVARIVARLTRKSGGDGDGAEPVRVAAFNSYI